MKPAPRPTSVRLITRAKRVEDGSDFLAVNPMGQVPVLRTDDGELLTENPVVLQYVADQYPNPDWHHRAACRVIGCSSG